MRTIKKNDKALTIEHALDVIRQIPISTSGDWVGIKNFYLQGTLYLRANPKDAAFDHRYHAQLEMKLLPDFKGEANNQDPFIEVNYGVGSSYTNEDENFGKTPSSLFVSGKRPGMLSLQFDNFKAGDARRQGWKMATGQYAPALIASGYSAIKGNQILAKIDAIRRESTPDEGDQEITNVLTVMPHTVRIDTNLIFGQKVIVDQRVYKSICDIVR